MGETAAETEKSKGGAVPVVPLILAVCAAVVIAVAGVGGAVFWLVKSGRLPMGSPAKVEAAEKKEPVKSKLVPLDPLLVNLADEGGHAYLRVGIVMREEEPEPAKGDKKEAAEEKPEKGKAVVKEADLVMRDVALSVVGHETAERLLAADGKEKLKTELQKAMQDKVPGTKILDVLFTEFLVQR